MGAHSAPCSLLSSDRMCTRRTGTVRINEGPHTERRRDLPSTLSRVRSLSRRGVLFDPCTHSMKRVCRVEMQDFVENDLYAVRYDRIRALLVEGTVELV